jgi:hypothetical protein
MKSKQVVLMTGSSTGFGPSCNRRGISGCGEFSEQWLKPMRLFKFLARLVLAITLAGVAAKANAQSIDEPYQAAKKEGSLSLNGGGLAGLYEPWVREFEQRFPGIKVKLTADFSNILAPIIDREIAERKLSVDLTIFQTLQDYDRWKKQGVLMSFKPEGWDQIHQSR